jgi:hypothetical protein
VLEDQSQRDALEAASILSQNGIVSQTSRSKGSRDSYALSVSSSKEIDAKNILFKSGFPKQKGSTLEEILATKSIIPGSREIEELRIDYTLALEIEKILKSVKGVTDADVVVRQNYNRGVLSPPLFHLAPPVSESEVEAQKNNFFRSKVAVSLQVSSEYVTSQEQIFTIVSKTLPGLTYDDLTLIVSLATLPVSISTQKAVVNDQGGAIYKTLIPFVGQYYVASDSYRGLAFIFLGSLFVMAMVGSLIGYWYGYFKSGKAFIDDVPDVRSLPSIRKSSSASVDFIDTKESE